MARTGVALDSEDSELQEFTGHAPDLESLLRPAEMGIQSCLLRQTDFLRVM